ncbi:helix-turn-helix domain-containing protein [Herbiconiux sp.]|uniref:helix-turn-helix domain-containing protein n=1 Tax=Herbiconiux sp. TaxID=1871186 RepID=UPI0025C35F20|nr:helix-turn-helix domain-containing protein [Herbiconiux sp.]
MIVSMLVLERMTNQWLTDAQCSSKTGIPTGTLRDWQFKKQNICFSRIGRLVRYSEAEVEAYLQSQGVEVQTAAQ